MMIPGSLGSEVLFLLSSNAASLRQEPCDQEEEARNAIYGATAPQRAWVCPLHPPELKGSRYDKHLSNTSYMPRSEGQHRMVIQSRDSGARPSALESQP